MLAYTNRFVVLAGLVRELYAEYEEEQNEIIARQIENLQTRITVIKYMQIFGALSFSSVLCVCFCSLQVAQS